MYSEHEPEPAYLGFDPLYGHRWSDGGQKYGRMSLEQVEEVKLLAHKHHRRIVIAGGWAETEIGVHGRILAYEEFGDRIKKEMTKEQKEAAAQLSLEKYGVPWWRLTGAPESGLDKPGSEPDFDYWVKRTTRDLSRNLKGELVLAFFVSRERSKKHLRAHMSYYLNPHNRTSPYIDNYNKYNDWAEERPSGAITFYANKKVDRNIADWQRHHPLRE